MDNKNKGVLLHVESRASYQARYIPFYHVRQYTQINVYFIKAYGTVPIAYGCTEVYEAIMTWKSCFSISIEIRDFRVSYAIEITLHTTATVVVNK